MKFGNEGESPVHRRVDRGGGGFGVLDSEKARFEPGDEIGFSLRVAGEDDFVEAVEALDEVGRSHFFAGEEAEFGRSMRVESRDEDAAVGDDVPGMPRARAEVDGIKEEAESTEDEGEAEDGNDFPPAFPKCQVGGVVPDGAEDGPGRAVENRREAAEDEDVGAGLGVPEDFFAGGEAGGELGRHGGILAELRNFLTGKHEGRNTGKEGREFF